MAIYINELTQEYPQYIGQIQEEFPEWEDYENPPQPWALVKEIPLPELEEKDIVVRNYAEFENNEWVQKWEIKTLTDEEYKEYQDNMINSRLSVSLQMTQDQLDYLNMTVSKIKQNEEILNSLIIDALEN